MMNELLALLADPDRLDSLPKKAIPALIGEAAALQAKLQLRLQGADAHETPQPPTLTQPDHLLTVKDAAVQLGVSVRWMYRHHAKLPFTRRLTGGTLRFSARGLERWKDSRR